MISKRMEKLVKNNSVIREMFEEGKQLAKKYGKENVYDFSLGNPSVAVPDKVNETIIELVKEDKNIHAYMSNSGYEDVRKSIAESINKKNNVNFDENNITMCVGAAGGINVVFNAILNPDDEVIVLIPYFMEYRNYIENFQGKVVEVKCDSNFEPDMDELKNKINSKTKAIIINNPNNPSGIVYSKDTILNISKMLVEKEKEYQNTIYLISDEPYREIIYDENVVEFLPNYYKDTIIVYSYSKALSLPGERIGYIAFSNEIDEFDKLSNAMSISTRILGFVNAPSLLQKTIKECNEITSDMNIYKINRDILYNGLTKLGYECKKPQGAFYLFMKTPIEDDREFCNIAKKYNILMVPGSSFACPGYVRLAFCVETEMIKNSLNKFEELQKNLDKKNLLKDNT